MARAEQAFIQWQGWLKSPQAAAQRAASRNAYAHEGAVAALATDRKGFPGAIDAPGYQALGGVKAAGGKILSRLGPNGAEVEDARGHMSLAESVLPIDGNTPGGKSAPLDLALISQRGLWLPQSALVPISIPGRSDGQVQFTADKFGLSFGSGSAVTGEQLGGSVYYPNVDGPGSDTDAVARAVPVGAEVSYMLRSVNSPQTQTLAYHLPLGWKLHDPGDHSGNVDVVDASGKIVASVLAPIATDAQGQTVPASYQIKGTDQLELDVLHRGGDYEYPILVDPITSDFATTSVYANWGLETSDNNNPPFYPFNSGGVSGLSMQASTYYPANTWGEYLWQPPQNSYVYAVHESGVYHNAYQSCEFGGIHVNGSGWEPGTWSEGTTGASGSPADSNLCTSNSTAYDYWYCARSECTYGVGSNQSNPIDAGAYAVVGLTEGTNATTQPSANQAWMDLSDATVYMADDVIPTVASVTHSWSSTVPAGWISDATTDYTDSLTATGSAPSGLGMYELALSNGSNTLATYPSTAPACANVNNLPSGTSTAPCPTSLTSPTGALTYDTRSLPEGINNMWLTAINAGGNNSGQGSSPTSVSWPLKIDRTAPQATITVTDGNGNAVSSNSQLTEAPLAVSVNATDPNPNGANGVSGVTKVILLMDGNGVDTQTQSCPNGGCSMNVTWTMNPEDFGEGRHTLTVDAYDQAGNELAAMGTPQTFTFYDHHSATATVGPGSVNLKTGELTLSTTDVSIHTFGAALAVGRTYESRHPTAGTPSSGWPLSIFGPQWTTDMPFGHAGGDYAWLAKNGDGTITIDGTQGDQATFSSSLVPPSGWEDMALAVTSTAPTVCSVPGPPAGIPSPVWYTLTDSAGGVTVFGQNNASTPNAFIPVCEAQNSATSSTAAPNTSVTWTFDASGRPQQEIGPAPAGVTCSGMGATTTKGCRSLWFTYATSTTSSSGCPTINGTQTGDYTGRLTWVSLLAWDDAANSGAGAMDNVQVAHYCYDSTGRLVAEYDPRLSQPLITTYGYDSTGHITSITPPGMNAWRLNYGTITADSNPGRLISVQRTDPANGAATTTIAYNVPVSGTGAPYAMDATSVSQWGQVDGPATATAIFPADEVPTSGPPADYTHATIYYLDSMGREVNVASPAASTDAYGRISTTEYDTSNAIYTPTTSSQATDCPASAQGTCEYNLVTRTLSPAMRAAALAQGSSAADQAYAKNEDTQYAYASNGIDVTEVRGPQHSIMLPGNGSTVLARSDTTYQYTDASANDAHQPTIVKTGAWVSGADQDVRETDTTYDQALGKPTTVTTVMSTGSNIVHTTVYDDTTGNVTDRVQPSGTVGGQGDTKTVYYSAGPNSTYSTCGSHPEWANLTCVTGPAQQPTNAPAGTPAVPYNTVAQYNVYDQPLVAQTASTPGGSATRTTNDTYDAAGRLQTESTSATNGEAASPTVNYGYDPNTGLPTTRAASGGGTITTGYDALGRITSYTDADGNQSSFTYDIDGRTKTINDGKGAQTYSYDSTSGDLVSLQDTAAGTFTAAYDANGALKTETYPNGMSANYAYDETGARASLTYTQTSNCSSNCTWYADTVTPSIDGQWLQENSTLANRSYSYDNAGRLTQVQETFIGQTCTTRAYAYDQDSNRQSQATATSTTSSCQTGGASTGHTYDNADRLIDAGVTYDTFGNTLSLPAADAGGSTLNSTYYANNRLQSQSQNGTTVTYNYDAAMRVRERVTSGASTADLIDHFSSGSDNPSWSASGTAWNRYIQGIGGQLAGIQGSTGTLTLQLTNLHGDVVGSVADTANAVPSLAQTTDEFGVPYNGTSAQRFAWLGGRSRTTVLASGLIDMGQREYVPELGRFEQVDPVANASAGAYDYSNQDPVNASDLTGQAPCYNAANCFAQQFTAKFASLQRQMLRRHFSDGTINTVSDYVMTGFYSELFNLTGASNYYVSWRYYYARTTREVVTSLEPLILGMESADTPFGVLKAFSKFAMSAWGIKI